MKRDYAPMFNAFCRANGLPAPVDEYRFHDARKWRFDFCWPRALVAIEVDGGVWVRGRHNRGAGMIKDFEKINEATALGWEVLRVTPAQLCTSYTVGLLKRLGVEK